MKATVSRHFASDQRLAGLLFVLAASVASTAVIANPERPRLVAVASNGPTGSALIPLSIDDVISHYLADRIEPSTSRGTRVAAVEIGRAHV